METVSAKEKYLICNSLACIPTLLEGQSILIDLRNETSVAGRILNADGFMNIHLYEAVFIDRHGLQYEFDEFIVKNRCIRQIQIPKEINIANELDKMMSKVGKREPRNQKRNLKEKRAKDRHDEIVNEIAQQQNKDAAK
ncbi:U7 snRNA-associated Sm-like protein LSm10 [Episyrphus balteatus]|uniref:U7 snRNA-associated Sm-like protein LSm10 n=1 Tax=Episyrphus balteatus TaxID=286459 RepID=UPI0024862C28|nr:U7 snRNA-associated Sm-like protein LSm10 [Episyrphus balteatus]